MGASDSGSADQSASGAAITVVSMEKLQVAGSFAEADAAALAKEQPATLTFPALPDVTAEGTVTWVSPMGDSSSGVVTYTATVTLTEAPEDLRLGQTADITVVTSEAAGVLNLPSNAVTILSETEGTVELLDPATVDTAAPTTTTTPVGIGLQGDSAVEITSGLAEGDQVLVSIDTATGGTGSTTQQMFGGAGGMAGFGGGTAIRGGMGGGAIPGGAPNFGGGR
jgi:macrolide-specific efflux system membrane fusion protein